MKPLTMPSWRSDSLLIFGMVTTSRDLSTQYLFHGFMGGTPLRITNVVSSMTCGWGDKSKKNKISTLRVDTVVIASCEVLDYVRG